MSQVTEEWGRARYRLTRAVEVSGPDAWVESLCLSIRPSDRVVRAWVLEVEITWTWDAVELEVDQPHLVRVRTPRGGWLRLDQLILVPEWLQSIITRSMPRL